MIYSRKNIGEIFSLWTFFSVLVILFVCSCNSSNPDKINQIITLSRDNKSELQEIIDHYKNPKDSLKLKAAFFLLENMDDKFSLEGESIHRFERFLDEVRLLKENSENATLNYTNGSFVEVDSLWKMSAKNLSFSNSSEVEFKKDIDQIDAGLLIENIEYAFKAWDFPWSKQFSFEDFCRYILPYRFSVENLQSWRPNILNKYQDIIDSLINEDVKNPYVVCEIFNKKLSSWWKFEKTIGRSPYPMSMDYLFDVQMGSCLHQTQLNTYVMRALGIAVSHEIIPNYGNRSMGHHFNSIIMKNDEVDFEIGNTTLGDVIAQRQAWNFSIPKVYRKEYQINPLAVLYLDSDSIDNIPPIFRDLCLYDVTDKYVPVSDIKIKLNASRKIIEKTAYLAVFNDSNWEIIANGAVDEGGYASFQNLGLGIIYLPVTYSKKGIVPIGNPFLLDVNGQVEQINPISNETTISLKRKYGHKAFKKNSSVLNLEFKGYTENHTPKKEMLLTIIDTLDRLIPKIYDVSSMNSFSKVRIVVPKKSQTSLSEIWIYDKNSNRLKGNTSTNNIENSNLVGSLFDDNVLTYLTIKTDSLESWIDINFEEEKTISSIKICPRTDKNDVWPGLRYELFYWNQGWQPLGIKMATNFSLDFQTPVTKALFLIRCLDEGKEERIFLYENNDQIWY